MYLIVGLPGAGKTARARELEISESALRLTPDDWVFALFSDDHPTRWRSRDRVAQRDRIEGKLVEIGLRVAELGSDVVLDFGLWSQDERSALRWIAGRVGVRCQVVYLPIDAEEQLRRVDHRFASEPGQFQLTAAELLRWRGQFQEPEDDELSGAAIPPVPAGYRSWSHWASQRWPSLPDRY